MKPALDLHIEGMTCAACSSRIERVLNAMPGVTAQVSLMEHRARIEGLSADDAIAAIRRAGYDAQPLAPHQALQGPAPAGGKTEKIRNAISALALAIMLIELGAMLGGRHAWVPIGLQFVLASLMQFFVALPFYRSALRALTHKSANMETLVSLGTLSAYGWSAYVLVMHEGMQALSFAFQPQALGHEAGPPLYFEASVVVIAMVRLGRLLEDRARRRALEALDQLIHIDAQDVEFWSADKNQWIGTAPQTIAKDSLIRIAPNGPISLDGLIVRGKTEIDESPMTGESQPAVRGEGERVFAGCRNLTESIEVRTTALFHESRRAEIGQKILGALASRAPIAALADRISAIFVPSVLAIAVLTFAAHLLAGGAVGKATEYAVAVLVVACPCALGLATPAAIAAGLARAAQQGWLFQSADALQRSASIDELVFDKTGTLTSGRAVLVDLESAPSDPGSADRQTVAETKTTDNPWPQWMAAACSLERGIEHPLAGALLSYASGRPMPDVVHARNIAGSGVEGEFRKASDASLTHTICVGKPDWVATRLTASIDRPLDNLYPWATEIHVAIDGRYQGRLWIADALRPDAISAIATLVRHGYRIQILSGDKPGAVQRVAEILGGLEFLAGQTPEQKTEKLAQWKSQGRRIAMVGDGINDAGAMAHAQLGIAMSAGSLLALQTADLTITNNAQLASIDSCLTLSKAVMARVKENLAFAFAFNILAIPLAGLGHLSPAIAGSAMAVSSAIVMINATRLLRYPVNPRP